MFNQLMASSGLTIAMFGIWLMPSGGLNKTFGIVMAFIFLAYTIFLLILCIGKFPVSFVKRFTVLLDARIVALLLLGLSVIVLGLGMLQNGYVTAGVVLIVVGYAMLGCGIGWGLGKGFNISFRKTKK